MTIERLEHQTNKVTSRIWDSFSLSHLLSQLNLYWATMYINFLFQFFCYKCVSGADCLEILLTTRAPPVAHFTTYKTLSFSHWKFPPCPVPPLNFHQSREREVLTASRSCFIPGIMNEVREQTMSQSKLRQTIPDLCYYFRPASKASQCTDCSNMAEWHGLLGFWRIYCKTVPHLSPGVGSLSEYGKMCLFLYLVMQEFYSFILNVIIN